MQLPLKLPWDLASPRWASILNPLLASPLTQGQQISVDLVAGANTIYHSLGQAPQGWIVVDVNAAITLFRSQPFNTKTLTLTASAPATASIYIF